LDPRALILLGALLPAAGVQACARRPPAATASYPLASGAGSAASSLSPSPSLPPPRDVNPGTALGLAPEEGEIVVRTDVLRKHPVGASVGSLFALWPGWGGTLRALVRDPVADLDWIDVVGPTGKGAQRMLCGTTSEDRDAAITGRLVALQARSSEPATAHVAAGLPAAAARLDAVLRVAFRPQPRFVAASAVSRGPELSAVLARDRLHPPTTDAFEALRADVPHPHDALPLVPAAIERLRAHIVVRANGDADGTADGACDNEPDASRAAAALRDAIARQNSAVVHFVTHGLLDGISVATEGSHVTLHLYATRDQLEATVTVIAALVPPPPAPGGG
jgi:hypothetical protein